MFAEQTNVLGIAEDRSHYRFLRCRVVVDIIVGRWLAAAVCSSRIAAGVNPRPTNFERVPCRAVACCRRFSIANYKAPKTARGWQADLDAEGALSVRKAYEIR